MNWMILPLKRYFDFKGRSRRKEYWMYTLFLVIASIVLSIVDAVLGLGGSASSDSVATDTTIGGSAAVTGGWLANIFSIATFIPSLAVAVRRLHDLAAAAGGYCSRSARSLPARSCWALARRAR